MTENPRLGFGERSALVAKLEGSKFHARMGVPKFPFLMEIRSNHAFTMLLAAYVTFTAHIPNKSKSIRHFKSEFRNRHARHKSFKH